MTRIRFAALLAALALVPAAAEAQSTITACYVPKTGSVYRIEAIGPDGLLDRFMDHDAFRGRVAQRIEFFGLEFATAVQDEVTLPAFVGNTRFRWAVPLEEAGG